nr:hypothetical protein [Acinetobacter baumannii]
ASNLALDANAMATYFYPDGSPRKVGETMTNKAYARTGESSPSNHLYLPFQESYLE